MAFDLKKEFKEYYQPKNKPEIVNIPSINYLAVRGSGDPNDETGDYKKALESLYAVAYTLRMSYKTDYKINGFYEYIVPPLEDGTDGVNYADKTSFNWISVIRLPDFISGKDIEWAVRTATKKKKTDCSQVKFLTVNEGLCVQIMHIGPYDNEPVTVKLMDDYLAQNGYENDLNSERMHHEIYLSDPRKCLPEKMKTVIRHPVKRLDQFG